MIFSESNYAYQTCQHQTCVSRENFYVVVVYVFVSVL